MEERSKQFPDGGTFKSVLSSKPHIPDDILFKEILPKVPTKSLLRFQSVSKSWMARISSDSAFFADHTAHHSTTTTTKYTIMSGCTKGSLFVLSHHDWQIEKIDTRHIIDRHDSMNLAGACNGLACISFGVSLGCDMLVIWNPVTRVHRVLPESVYWCWFSASYSFGFGSDSCIDYKVVRLVQKDNNIDVHLFTKRSGRWRQLNDLSGFEFPNNRKGLPVDGTMYWEIQRPTPHQNPHWFLEERILGILSFDLCTEKFQELDVPTLPDEEGWKLLELIKWKGCLGAVLVDKNHTQFQLWLRTNNEDDNKNRNFCWKNIAIDHSERPLDDCNVIKDLLIKEYRGSNFYEMFDHVPSFVSPH